MGISVLICFICRTEKPPFHTHHVFPSAYGGISGPTVTLCPNHHMLIHSLASKDLDSHIWDNPCEKTRGELLVSKIKQTKTLGSSRYTIQYVVDQDQRLRLECLKRYVGTSSISKTVAYCVNVVMKKLGI